jgi:hypothetical protein
MKEQQQLRKLLRGKSDDEIREILNQTMISALLDRHEDEYIAMSDEELLDVYKEKVVGLIRVGGVWMNLTGDIE